MRHSSTSDLSRHRKQLPSDDLSWRIHTFVCDTFKRETNASIAYCSSDDAPAFKPKFEFLKNESTQGVLVFKWKPTVEGQFPPGVRMRLRVVLPHFNDSIYIFDMTPSKSLTQLHRETYLHMSLNDFLSLGQSTPSHRTSPWKLLLPMKSRSSSTPACHRCCARKAFKTKRIKRWIEWVEVQRKEKGWLTSHHLFQTWTLISTNRNGIVVGDLRSSSFYRVCMRCRERFADPQGVEQCQLIKTWNPFSKIFCKLGRHYADRVFVQRCSIRSYLDCHQRCCFGCSSRARPLCRCVSHIRRSRFFSIIHVDSPRSFVLRRRRSAFKQVCFELWSARSIHHWDI